MRDIKDKAALYSKHIFWDTQPVPKYSEVQSEEITEGELETKEIKDVRDTPYALPEGFEWCTVDLNNDKELLETYDMLRENYVEDKRGDFRLKYPPKFLKWSIMVPGYIKDWIIGLRVKGNQKLVGFIAGIPLKISIKGKLLETAEIDFLCVHPKLRTKRMAPVLIKEVTRRVNMRGIWQAIYTAGKYIPTPISETCYNFRPLNYKRLLDVIPGL